MLDDASSVSSIKDEAKRNRKWGEESCLGAIKCVQPRCDASASYERGPIENGEARRARTRLGGVQGAGGEQVVVRGVDRGHGGVVLRREAAHVRGIFDAAIDGEPDVAVEFVVQHLVAV